MAASPGAQMQRWRVRENIAFLGSQDSFVPRWLSLFYEQFILRYLKREKSLKSIVRVQLRKKRWADFFDTDAEKSKFASKRFSKKICNERFARLIQMSWVVEKDTLVLSVWHVWILLHSVEIHRTYRGKRRKVMEEKSKLLQKLPDETWDFNHWKRTSISQVCRADLEFLLHFHHIPASTDVYCSFGHVISIDVINEYMRYILEDLDTSQGASSHIGSTVVSLSWSDAFFSTVVYCLCSNGVDRARGHRQKLYSNTFPSFFPIAFS